MKYADFVREEFGEEYVFEVGDWVVTNREVSCMIRSFEKGTRVQIIDVSARGYDLMDEHGNRIIETGFDSVCKC